MRIRTIAGTVVVLALALAGILKGLFPNFGGGGNGDGPGDGPRPQADAPEEPAVDPAPDVAPPDRVPPQVLNVLVEDRHYAVRRTAGGREIWNRVELDRVVALAEQTPGNADGVRVRIVRDESARASAEIELHERLLEAGLPKESIVTERDLIRNSDSE